MKITSFLVPASVFFQAVKSNSGIHASASNIFTNIPTQTQFTNTNNAPPKSQIAECSWPPYKAIDTNLFSDKEEEQSLHLPPKSQTPKIEKITTPNGITMEGTFVNNELDGKDCTLTYEDGTTEHGEFKQGVLVEGIRTDKHGFIEKGSFLNGYLHGDHCIKIFNGMQDEGVFDQGLLTYGTRKFPQQTQEGYFRKNILLHGKVTYEYGWSAEGTFYHDQYLGVTLSIQENFEIGFLSFKISRNAAAIGLLLAIAQYAII